MSQPEVNPDGRFAGQVVLITGATSGIGEATARAFAAQGATVHFCGRRQELGQQVAQSIVDAVRNMRSLIRKKRSHID